MRSLNIQKILLPIDFSEASMNALHTAISVARKHNAQIKLLFVHSDYENYYPQINLNSANDIITALTTLAKLIEYDELVSCGFSYMMGDVSNCIVEMANTEKAELVVIGKNGNSGGKKNSAGSIACSVIRKSTCPVLLVPAGKTWNSFLHILFPVRPTLCMLEKFVAIKEIVKKDDSLLYILNLRNPSQINELHIISKLVQLLKIKMKQEKIQTSISYYFRDMNFAEKILAVADDSKNKIDLLVISPEEYNTEKAHHISSYAQKIIHNTSVPVLIIKPSTVEQSKEMVLMELKKHWNYN